MSKYWSSDIDTCEVCSAPVVNNFVDGRLAAQGSWACMCMPCHARQGVGLGTGRGQHYQRQSDGRWLKVEG